MNVVNLFAASGANETKAVVAVAVGDGIVRALRTYQATVTGTGAVTATVTFFGSNDNTNFSTTAFGTITLSGTTSATDNFASSAGWPYVRCTTASVTGTGALVIASVAL